MVMAARHAVSIDERRKSFPPTLWRNLGDLNRETPERRRSYQQLWFAGDHGSVGGGGDIVGLSNIALRWVAEGAVEQGLEMRATRLAVLAADEDHHAALFNTTAPPSFFTKLMRRKVLDRVGRLTVPDPETGEAREVPIGPDYLWDISHPARRRWLEDSGYRPPALEPLGPEFVQHEAESPVS